MKNPYVRIQGIASPRCSRLLYGALELEPPSGNYLLLFLDFSDFTIPTGFRFSMLIERGESSVVYPIRGMIDLVTQWDQIVGEIPEGEKTLCNLALDEASYNLISSKIPVVDTWTQLDQEFLMSTTDDTWRKYYGQ